MKNILKLFYIILGGFIFLGNAWGIESYIFYYLNGCSHCAKVESYFEKNQILQKFDIKLKEIGFDSTNRQEYLDFNKKLNIPEAEQGVPLLILNPGDNCSYLGGDTPIINFFDKKLKDLNAQQTCTNTTGNNQNIDITNNSSHPNDNFTTKIKYFLVLLPAAIADSINPCAFAVMLLLLSTFLTKHKNTRRVILAGFAFSSAIFLGYFLLGVGFYEFLARVILNKNSLASANTVYYLKLIVGIIGILIGLANIKDYFWYGKGFIMEVPLSWRPTMMHAISSVTSLPGAFGVGLLVTFFLLPCSSGPYITVLSYLASENPQLTFWGYIYLFVYNLIFILPMIAITFIVAYGYNTINNLAKMKESNKKLIHLIVGILMIGLGGYVLILG